MKKLFCGIILFAIISLVIGCATIPIMNLSHFPSSKGYEYDLKGSIRVVQFDDERPLNEREGGKRPKNSTQVWSGSTNPVMRDFLFSTIKTEIQKSGLFEISKSADYELSGVIKSLKVERRLGTLAYVAMPFSFAGGFLIGLGDVGSGLIVSLPGLVLSFANHDPIMATVAFDAVLEKEGEIVWQDNILRKYDEKMWSGFSGINKISKTSAVVLDRAITITVRDMIKEINE